MEALELRNLRSLTNTGRVQIAPITLLLGQNSSGKSTFVRFLPMLKQGTEARTREPLLWLGRLVDFGSAEEAYSRFAKDPSLGLTLHLGVPTGTLDGRRRMWQGTGEPPPLEHISVSINYRFIERSTQVEAYDYEFTLRGHTLSLTLSELGKVASFKIDGVDCTALASGMVGRWTGPVPVLQSEAEDTQLGRGAYAELFDFVSENSEGRTGPDRRHRLARALTVGSWSNLYERAVGALAADEYWRRQVKSWTQQGPKFRKLTELVIAYQFFNDLNTGIATYVRRVLSNVRYITPIRASAERYYRLQGLSIEEIDPQGENIAMFLHNLSPQERSSFGDWMRQFFDVEVATQPSRGHVSLILKAERSTSQGYNLADTGFGYSQMLPILVQLWSIGTRKRGSTSVLSTAPVIFAIEQPELHLHPKLQAKLADVFVKAVRAATALGVDLRLVVETHSEQLVSAIGLRVAEELLEPKEVNIVLFEKENLDAPTTVTETSFTSAGTLKNWPYGFFEAEL